METVGATASARGAAVVWRPFVASGTGGFSLGYSQAVGVAPHFSEPTAEVSFERGGGGGGSLLV